MINLQISFDARDAISNINNIADQLEKQNAIAVRSLLVDGQTEARRRVKKKQGTLMRSIEVSQVTASGPVASGTFGSQLPYALITELGGWIKPKNKGFLAWYDPKHPLAAKRGKYQGWVFTKNPVYHPANPFLFPTLVARINTWVKMYGVFWDQVSSTKGGGK